MTSKSEAPASAPAAAAPTEVTAVADEWPVVMEPIERSTPQEELTAPASPAAATSPAKTPTSTSRTTARRFGMPGEPRRFGMRGTASPAAAGVESTHSSDPYAEDELAATAHTSTANATASPPPHEAVPPPQPEYAAILERVVRWYHLALARGQLPKTRDKLVHALTTLCVRVEVVPMQPVYSYLLAQRFFTLLPLQRPPPAKKGKKPAAQPLPPKQKLTYVQARRQKHIDDSKAAAASTGPVSDAPTNPDAAHSAPAVPPLELAKQRAADWIATCKEPPTSVEGLQHSLEQLCRLKLQLNTSKFVDWLGQCRLVLLHPDDRVVYNFPANT